MLLKLKKNFYNLKYGKCYILQKRDSKYLLYVPNYQNSYIVCDYIGTDNALIGQHFFTTLKEANHYYKNH